MSYSKNYSRLVMSGTALLFAAGCSDVVPTAVSLGRAPVASLTATAVTGLIVDQSNTSGFTGFVSSNATGGSAQGFTPTASSLTAVDLFLFSFLTDRAVTLTVNIRSGTHDGAILGTTTVEFPAGAGGTLTSPTVVQAVFAKAIPLTPGSLYYIQIEPDGGVVLASTTSGDAYARGIVYQGGSMPAGRDIGFRTHYRAPTSTPQGPTTREQCKEGGWAAFTVPRTFNNQGDCVSFVLTGK